MLMINDKVKRFYDRPTQVAFYDMENDVYLGGIAHGDTIICLECGGTVEIEDFLSDIEECKPEVAFPIIELPWVNISDECLGEDNMFDIQTGEIV